VIEVSIYPQHCASAFVQYPG